MEVAVDCAPQLPGGVQGNDLEILAQMARVQATCMVLCEADRRPFEDWSALRIRVRAARMPAVGGRP